MLRQRSLSRIEELRRNWMLKWFNMFPDASCRVANVRKHQLLKPEIKALVTAIDSITPSNYVFEYLEVEAIDMQQMNLQLGFPAHVVHVVKPGSPLYNLSLQVGMGQEFPDVLHEIHCSGMMTACLH